MRMIDLAFKDLTQLIRDWKAAMFLLIMPLALLSAPLRWLGC